MINNSASLRITVGNNNNNNDNYQNSSEFRLNEYELNEDEEEYDPEEEAINNIQTVRKKIFFGFLIFFK